MLAHARRRPVHTLRGIAAAAIATSVVVSLGSLVPATQAQAATFTVKGVDVASWQHPSSAAINWTQVKNAGYSFAIIKATESTTYVNPFFAGDRTGAKNAGLTIGAYHFARPALPLSTATAQARYFVKAIGTQQLTRNLPPILDIEQTGGLSKTNLASWMKQFLVTVASATGRTPMIYSYDSFLRNDVANVAAFSAYPLWYAKYTSATPSAASLPGNWSSYRLWQHSSTGSVPGISGTTDLNWFNGTASQLSAFASGMAPAKLSRRYVQPHQISLITGHVDPAYVGEPIVRQSLVKGRWKTVEKKRVPANGNFSFTLRLTAKGSHPFRVFLDSQSPYARVPSKALTVGVVKPWVKVKASATSIRKGRTTHITGQVDLYYAGEKVVRQKKSASGKWVTMNSKKVNSKGRFDFGTTPSTRGKNYYRILLRATGPTAHATSRTLKITVS